MAFSLHRKHHPTLLAVFRKLATAGIKSLIGLKQVIFGGQQTN